MLLEKCCVHHLACNTFNVSQTEMAGYSHIMMLPQAGPSLWKPFSSRVPQKQVKSLFGFFCCSFEWLYLKPQTLSLELLNDFISQRTVFWTSGKSLQSQWVLTFWPLLTTAVSQSFFLELSHQFPDVTPLPNSHSDLLSQRRFSRKSCLSCWHAWLPHTHLISFRGTRCSLRTNKTDTVWHKH